MNKTRTIFSIKCLAAFAVFFMVIPAYANCKNRCGHSCGALCHESIVKEIHSDCCGRDNTASENVHTKKCNGNCCTKDYSPAAATYEDNYLLDNQYVDSICEDTIADSDTVPKKVNLSANSPLHLYNNTQAVLCVFII
ncbi:MAG: hypothetical protein JW806_07280 [Sedimentisphaerales bacterium]|nr:hypothetical protein [Sedimentisphaerales bacterium]